jgi:GntR family transcriptional regulator
MDREWNDSQPIYRQLRDRVVAMILDGVLKEGDPLPSVRKMFINTGARKLLLQGERQRFLAEEWPRVHATIQRLGLTAEELEAAEKRESKPNAKGEER